MDDLLQTIRSLQGPLNRITREADDLVRSMVSLYREIRDVSCELAQMAEDLKEAMSDDA